MFSNRPYLLPAKYLIKEWDAAFPHIIFNQKI